MQKLIAALIEFQKKVPSIPKNKINPFFKSTYADLSQVIETCRPSMNSCGLAISQVLRDGGDKSKLTTILMHDSGEMLESEISIPTMPDPQKLTAVITYLRRTQYVAILGMCADDDDDGNFTQATTQKKTPSPQPQTQDNKSTNEAPSYAQKKAIYAISSKKGIEVPKISSFEEATQWITEQNKNR